jgi:probable rRNA maturation factor
MNRALPRIPRIIVRDLQRGVVIDIAGLQDFAQRALMMFFNRPSGDRTQLRRLAEISILLISDCRMSSLHRRFLNTAGPTDVITFDHGEIFISVETARKHARRFKSSTLREIQLYIVHGLLHLNGYDDRSRMGARRMEMAQEKILDAVTVSPSDH